MEHIKTKKIIIAEDSEFSRLVIKTKLEKFGFNNIEAPESSVEVWDSIANATLNGEPYDLLITDLNMPDLDGMDLIDNIKSDPLSEKLKIVVVTADADTFIKSICLQMGALAVFNKPFNEENFIQIIIAILEENEIPSVVSFFDQYPKKLSC